MEATLNALAGLLLKATFTIIVLVLVHIYLRFMFFTPLDKVLKKRYEMTEGSRAAAQASMERASQRTAEYEAKLREARAAVLREQEEARQKWLADQAAQIQQARAKADELIRRTRDEVQEEVRKAQWELARESESLADEITQVILQERAA
jgi:F-type H+-transporting ATPase subunit b